MPRANTVIGRYERDARVKPWSRWLVVGICHHWVIHRAMGQGWRLCVLEVTLERKEYIYLRSRTAPDEQAEVLSA